MEPREVAAAITETFGRYDVRELICEPGDWTWVMLAMEFERLPIVKEPRSPQRSAKDWQISPTPSWSNVSRNQAMQRWLATFGNLTLRSDRSGFRPEVELASPGAFVNGAIAAMIAYDRATEHASVPPRVSMMAWA